MQCPTCNNLNTATDVRCLNCGTILIYEAVGHSEEYQQGADLLSSRMHRGLGALAGFFLTAVLLKFVFTAHFLSDRQVVLASTLAAVAGSVVGRLLFRSQRHL